MLRILNKHVAWTPACVVELYRVALVALKDMYNPRECFEGAKESPLHLAMGYLSQPQ